MMIKLSGRKYTIKSFLTEIEKISNCYNLHVTFPEAFKFCGDRDFTAATVEFSGNYLDFYFIRNRKFRSLEIHLFGERFEFVKYRGTCNLTRIDKPVLKKQSVWQEYNRKIEKEIGIPGQAELGAEDFERLGDFETLELFEERLKLVKT